MEEHFEIKFRDWFEKQKQPNGNYYSKNTINIYTSALKTKPNKLTGFENLGSLFKISNPVEYYKISEQLKKANNFDIVNNEDSNKAFSNALKKYGAFLEFYAKKDSKNTTSNEHSMNSKIINILTRKNNLILTGAPGTGKTYTTAEIAVGLIDGNTPEKREDLMKRYQELVKDGQIAFTTFHQSMDYEEFVEGLKPDSEEVGQFNVKAGIFKQLCEKAKKNFEDSEKKEEIFLQEKTTEEHLKLFIGKINKDIEENGEYFLYGIGGKQCAPIVEISPESFSVRTKNNNMLSSSLKNILKMYAVYLNNPNIITWTHQDVYEKLVQHHCTYYFGFIKAFNDFILNNKIEIKKPEKVKLKNFILIIDEINRGNISKILGELITLLEADKRFGKTNEISLTLPYSNESFSVPQNLYIIGTMNTADRSLGYIDYAIRRRFAFITLKADKSILENYYTNKNLKDKAVALFESVENIMKDKISSEFNAEDLMIGHSYFMAQDEAELEQKLQYEIIPLLLEYVTDGILTGSQTTKEDIEKLSLKNEY